MFASSVKSLIALALCTLPCFALAADEPPVVLRGEKVSVEAQVTDGRLTERYLALRDGQWIELATSMTGQTAGPVAVIATQEKTISGALAAFVSSGKQLAGKAAKVSLADGVLTEELEADGATIVRKVAIMSDGSWLHVSTRMTASTRTEMHAFTDQFKFAFKPDWCFSPSIGGFNPDAKYKAPVILVQSDRNAMAIVPDLAVLGPVELDRCNHAMDLDVPAGPLLTVGYMPAKQNGHTMFLPDPVKTWFAQPEAAIENAYYILLTATAEPGQAFRQAVRLHWDRFGRDEQQRAASQQTGTTPTYGKLHLWDDWRGAVWLDESRKMWIEAPLPDGSVGGGAWTLRWPDNKSKSVYLSAWFNTLRTSYAMALYARRTNNDELLKLAQQTLNLALKTPGKDGAFKCAAVPATDGRPARWGAGDGVLFGVPDGFLGYDMSWTGYWMLKWRSSGLPGSDDILPRCRKLADFLIARQGPDGQLTTRFREDGTVIQDTSRLLKAETGPVALFLLELYAQDPDPKFLDAARKGLAFMDKNVIPSNQWYDYETFFSCSPRSAKFDDRTQQWPENNLALSQTIGAYLAAFRATKDQSYLDQGERLADFLCLTQQCWTSRSPKLGGIVSPAMLLGGFTTQNSDAEWSDARQSQIGNFLLDYYRATGKVEYLERGVAAIRSQFPISPLENTAHEGYGGRGALSSFHWGTGSGMAGIEIEDDDLRDAVIDVAAGRGLGVNALNLTDCQVAQDTIAFKLATPFDWSRKAVVTFRHTNPQTRYKLTVNGTPAGEFTGQDLEKGIPLTPLKSLDQPKRSAATPQSVGKGAGTGDDLVIADFEAKDYGDWKVTGTAFGSAPAQGTLPDQQPVFGYLGSGLVNSMLHGDDATGTLTSPEVIIKRQYINLLVGGGSRPGQACVELMSGGKKLYSATGHDSEKLEWTTWDVSSLKGQIVHITILDKATAGWGHILVDQIVQSDQPIHEPQ